VVQAARPALTRRGIYLYYLPAYSPKLNAIEPLFKQIKHHEISRRSHTTKEQLRETVEQGFASYSEGLGNCQESWMTELQAADFSSVT
jgi:transposase